VLGLGFIVRYVNWFRVRVHRSLCELVALLDAETFDEVDGVGKDGERREADEDGEPRLLGRVEPLVGVDTLLGGDGGEELASDEQQHSN